MAVQYDFYKNPSPKENEGQTCYHARVVPYGTTDTVALAERIHSRCTVTPADVKAVLTSLSDVVIDELKAGNRVHIDGLGYLQITLECPTVQSPKEVRAESIRFKSIAFRPEAELKKRLCTTKFERISAKRHSVELADGQIDELFCHPYLYVTLRFSIALRLHPPDRQPPPERTPRIRQTPNRRHKKKFVVCEGGGDRIEYFA